MRFAYLFGLLGLLSGPSVPAAQLTAPATPFPWSPTPWQPTADYVTPGQDEPGYRRWLAANPFRSSQVATFHRYLSDAGVSYVAPTWQLLRTASDWQKCGAAPFEMPPVSEWANLVQTLRFVRDYVVPAIGPVEPVSGYRNPVLNRCAGGAAESVHMHFSAIDLVPLRPTGREALIGRLCALHARQGWRYGVGLGFYPKLRFHVDSWKFRTWGRNEYGSLACAASAELAQSIVPVSPPVAPTFAKPSTAQPAVPTYTKPATAPSPAPTYTKPVTAPSPAPTYAKPVTAAPAAPTFARPATAPPPIVDTAPRDPLAPILAPPPQ
jgi:hypothetical protein